MDLSILYLSPHPDDVVFSCGGSLILDCAQAQVVLVTAFTRPAEATVRLTEDRAAAARLGCRHHSLDLPAAAARPEVRGALDVFAPLGPQHLGITSELVARLRGLIGGPVHLVAPLAVGGHCDHRLCFVAARLLAESLALPLALYADQPYSQSPHAVTRRLQLLRARLVDGADGAETSAPAAVTDAAGVAGERRLLRSLPGLLPPGPWRGWVARRRARAQWHHERPATLVGGPLLLRTRLRQVSDVRQRHLQAIAAYGSQWPRYAASPQALYDALHPAGEGGAGAVEKFWDVLPRKSLGAAPVS